jgi:Arc/MetJ-type ribon-helix-helix transcriptional regulator
MMIPITIRISKGDDSDLRTLQSVGGFESISDVTREALRRGTLDMKKEYGLFGKRRAKKKGKQEPEEEA